MIRMSWEDDSIGPDVAAAGRLVSDYIGRDAGCFGTSSDLEEALEASRYSSHPYSSPPKEWPHPIEVVNARELPPVLVDRYNEAGGEGTALCGIFPEIRRAWASVDNSLFLWRFDKWDGQCPEYSGEEQPICAVGLAKAKPGIFVEAIQYLLVLATPVELILLGVCCSSSGDGTDLYAELSLQPLPEYTIPSDGVTMTCVACTDNGHIFLAGRDSHIYELQYSTRSGWHRRCRKVCLTGGLSNLISRWVLPNVLKFGAVDPIVELVIDNERYILYARTQESKIQVFDLGKNGNGPLKKVAEERNLSDQRDGRYGGGRSTGGRAASRMSKTSIVSIATVSTMESKWLHLVAVASDGRRMYLTTSPSIGTGGPVRGLTGLSTIHHRPSVLKVVTTRPSPSIGLGSGITFGSLSISGRPQAESLVMKVETAYYSGGLLLLSESSPATTSRLLIVNRDLTVPLMTSGSFALGGVGTTGRGPRPLRETVSPLSVEGRTLSISDVLPPPEREASVQASVLEPCDSGNIGGSSEMTRAKKLWARGDLATQHLLPRRRAVVFGTMGLMEIVFNRPVDILQRLLDSNAPRSLLEDFFQRFGPGEAAAMCLLLAARLICDEENIVSNAVAERAAEAFEDPRVVGMPQMQGGSALTNTISTAGVGFNMGQVVQDAEPIFSGAHEGLCLCASRLLWPMWELPVMVVKGESSDDMEIDNGVIVCRLPTETMQILENKIRSLEQFLRSRRNQRRGLYGRVVGLGDMAGSILYSANGNFGIKDQGAGRNLFNTPVRGGDQGSIPTASNKRQRVPYNPAELAAMEVRGIECIRRLLRRSGEALLLLQLLSQHHVARLAQSLDSNLRRKLAQLTFHQVVCSDEGDQIATRLVAALMEYYIGPDGRGTVDDISVKLREGCPSYYNESDYRFFQAVECLERAVVTMDSEEKERLAKEALDLLVKVPETADLLTVCKRFEDLRFYEAVVELPLQKARALDPAEDAINEQIDPNRRQAALALREQCYEVVMNALRSLKGEPSHKRLHTEFGSPVRHTASRPLLDQASQERYIRQIIQLSVRWPDQAFHEYLYRTMIELGLENELLELAGPDLVPFLQSASREQSKSGNLIFKSAMPSAPSSMTRTRQAVNLEQAKYLELLARYYVYKRQHVLAAHVLLRLSERRQVEGGEMLTLEQRYQYLSNAVLQARSACSTHATVNSMVDHSDNGLLELLEGKLAVLRFQMKIKEELERIASRVETLGTGDTSPSNDPFPARNIVAEDTLAQNAKEKATEISLELKSIRQLYNEYAVPFELWEVGPQDIVVIPKDEYEDDTTQSSSDEETQDDRYDAASWETADSDGMHIHDQEQQVEEYSVCQIDAHSDHDIAHGKSAIHAEERLNQGNSGTLSIYRAAFKFVAQLARGLLGFRESKMLSDASNLSNHGQCAQKHILDRTDLDIFEEKEFMRGSQYHLLESMDALYPIDDSAVLEGKEEAELCSPKDKSKYSGCKVDDQVQSFKECVDDLGEWTFNTVKKQKKEDRLSDLAASHNDDSRYLKHLDIVKDPVDHFFLKKTSQSTCQRRWTKKVQQEWAILEKNLPDTIYVRVYEDRMDLLRAVIIGAAGTPYQDGLFFFDIHLPTEYPHSPPSAHYHSGGLRLNPNLYENGKICLSLLNTWTGRGNEVWDPLNSSILQVLVSLQGLVLNSKPYFNEAGYDKQIGRAEGEKNSLAYNENSFLLSCKSMLYLLRKPPKHFESFVREHFHQRGHYILGACNAYMMGAQVGCLSGEAMMGVHGRADTQSTSSIGFKIMLAKLIPKLVSAFKEVGADCEEFVNASEHFGHVEKATI